MITKYMAVYKGAGLTVQSQQPQTNALADGKIALIYYY